MNWLSNYLLSITIPADSVFVRIGLITSGGLILMGIIAPLFVAFQKRKNRPLKYAWLILSFSNLARIAGIGWLILFFLRYEGIAPFNRRIWVYSLFIPVAVYSVILLMRFKKSAPVRKKEDMLRAQYEKYLPKPKAKRFLS